MVKVCPCGQNNSGGKFAPFDGHVQFGHCFSCDKTYKPTDQTLTIPQTNAIIKKVQASYHPKALVDLSCKDYGKNNFVQFLQSIFTKDEVLKALELYRIGTSNRWEGASVFFQIDKQQLVHSGKVLLYDVRNGKRVKDNDGRAFIDWAHSILKRNELISEFNLKQCLFGLHLVFENRKIALVESEKTAIIMSIFKPEYTWLATGSKSAFKYDMLLPIKEFQIVAFPDKSEFHDWSKKAEALNNFGFNIEVNDWLEEQDQYPDGTDLADVYISLAKNMEYSDTEKRVEELTKINPYMRNLIDTFGLVDYYGNEIRVFK